MRSIARGAAPCTEHRDAEDDSSGWHPSSAGRTTGQLPLTRIEVRPSEKLMLLLDLDTGFLEFLGHRRVSASQPFDRQVFGFIVCKAEISLG